MTTLRLEAMAIIDAHMSDCLQGCTMAEARHIAALDRHFQTATFGVNAFEYCETNRERRSMQEVDLMPFAHSLELARVYVHSDDPASGVGALDPTSAEVSAAGGAAGTPNSAGEPGTGEMPAASTFHVFLLLGQSNMAGYPKAQQQDRAEDPRV